jgi:hypothetical protein
MSPTAKIPGIDVSIRSSVRKKPRTSCFACSLIRFGVNPTPCFRPFYRRAYSTGESSAPAHSE